MASKKDKVFTAAQVADALGVELVGSGSVEITGVSSMEQADRTQLSFITSSKYAGKVNESKAAAVIVKEKLEKTDVVQLIAGDNVEKVLIDALNLFAPQLIPPAKGIHPTAVIEKPSSIAKDSSIGAGTYISHNVQIGEGAVISAGCVIGENSVIGRNSRIDAGVVIYHNCTIGSNCIIQANTTIGSTGFGYRPIDSVPKLIPHNGGVIIEDCAEIGANCCIDRAKFDNTVIGAGTKLDNLVQIAHNVVIGKCCLFASQVGVSGSCRFGDGIVVGGQAGFSEHLNIGSGAVVGGRTAVVGDVAAGSAVAGYPYNDAGKQLRIWSLTKRLPEMAKQLKQVAGKVKQLESAKDN